MEELKYKVEVEDTVKGIKKVFTDYHSIRKFTRLSLTAIKQRLAEDIANSPKKPTRHIITRFEEDPDV